MSSFEVEFVDGKKVVVDVATADQAKATTRAQRRAQVPPDTPRGAAEVKIRRVTPLDDSPAGERARRQAKE